MCLLVWCGLLRTAMVRRGKPWHGLGRDAQVSFTMTPDNVNTIRKLAEAAGGRDALIRWVMQVLPKPIGRPRGSSRFLGFDEAIIAAAKSASERCGVPVATLLRHNVAMIGAPAGASPDAAVERLQSKARRAAGKAARNADVVSGPLP
jgi:hypothetical protein